MPQRRSVWTRFRSSKNSPAGSPARHESNHANNSELPQRPVHGRVPSEASKGTNILTDHGDMAVPGHPPDWIRIAIESLRIDPILPGPHPEARIADAQGELQKSIVRLLETLDTRPVSSPNASLIDGDDALKKFITDLRKVQGDRQHDTSRKLQSFMAKIYPVASFVLDTVAFGAQAVGFLPLKIVAKSLDQILELAKGRDELSNAVTERLERLEDYYWDLEVIRDAGLDDSSAAKISVIVGGTRLLKAITCFLREGLIYLHANIISRLGNSAFGDADLNKSMEGLDSAVKEFHSQVHFGMAGDMWKKTQDQENLETLSSLSEMDFKNKHMQLRKDRFSPSKLWILEEPQFKEWRSSGKALLWCRGSPGAGKTFLMSSILDSICPDYARWIANPLVKVGASQDKKFDRALGVACIYCETQRQEEQTAAGIMRSIIRQLVEEDMSSTSGSRSDFGSALSQVKRFLSKNEGSPTLSSRSLTGLLSSVMTRFDETIVLIDALDECAYRMRDFPNREELINVLSGVPTLKLLVTSRDPPFKSAKLIEIKPKPIDVDEYVAFRLSGSLAKLGDKKDLQLEIKNVIRAHYSAMFILLRLFLDLICKLVNIGKVKAQLAGKPLGLNDFYQKSIERIETGERAETATRLLFLLLSCRSPLSILEVQDALAVQGAESSGAKHEDFRVEKETLWDCCAGLVIVNVESQILNFAHESVRDYLSSDDVRTRLFSFDLQTEIAGNCLKYLTYNVFGSGPCEDMAVYRKRLHDYPFLRYAAQHWGYHVRGPAEGPLMGEILALFRQGLKLSCAIQAMHIPIQHNKANDFPKGVHGLWIASFFGLNGVIKHLLQEGQFDTDAPVSNGETGLMSAAKEGYAVSVRSLLEGKAYLELKGRFGNSDLDLEFASRKAYLEHRNRSGFTALFWAARKGHENCVLVLFGEGANVDATDDDGETSLIGAAWRWNRAMLQLLLDCGANINARDRYGDTAIIRAAKNGRTATVQYLISKGASLKMADEAKRTPLIAAAEDGYERVVELILTEPKKRGDKAILEAKDWNGETALIRAVKRRNTSVVELLLEHKAEVEVKDQYGNRPLYLAASQGNDALLDAILKKNPDLDAENEEERTALMVAADGGHVSIVECLINKGASVEKMERHGESALISAIRKGRVSIVPLLLLNQESTIEGLDRRGETALIAACQKNSEELGENSMVLRLLDSHAKVNNQGEYGKGPLSWAAEGGNINLVKLLLDRGADLNHADNQGYTPLMYAVENGHEKVMELLLERGATLGTKSLDKEYPDTEYSDTKRPLILAIRNEHRNLICRLRDEMMKITSETHVVTIMWGALFFKDNPYSWSTFLIDKGFNINLENERGETLLDCCSQSSLASQVEFEGLLDLKATHGRRFIGQTPLTAAVKALSPQLVQAYLERGVDTEDRNADGRTALLQVVEETVQLVCQYGPMVICQLECEIAELLLRKGADANAKDHFGQTSLDLAIQQRCVSLVEVLLDHEVEVSDENRSRLESLLTSKKEMEEGRLLQS